MDEIWVGRELHSLEHLIRRYFEFSSHKNEVETVTGNNGWIIGYLSENEGKNIYQKDIEDHFTITRSTVSKVLRLMERKDLIQRQPVAHDARLKKIVLTAKARQVQSLVKEDMEMMERTITKGFTKEELKTLHSYIQRMKKNIIDLRPDFRCSGLH
jgi:DNA-binding MarR family transcriptional regulator